MNTNISKIKTKSRFYLQVGMIFAIAICISTTAYLTYMSAHNSEIHDFEHDCEIMSENYFNSLQSKMNDYVRLSNSLSVLYSSFSTDTEHQSNKWPNVTLHGFQHILNELISVPKGMIITWQPRISKDNRKSWEQYAYKEIDTNGPDILRTGLQWPIKNGVKTVKKYTDTGLPIYEYAKYDDLNPYDLFPLWQIAPLNEFTKDLIMFSRNQPSSAFDIMIDYSTISIGPIGKILPIPSDQSFSIIHSPVLHNGVNVGCISVGFTLSILLSHIHFHKHTSFVIVVSTNTNTKVIFKLGEEGIASEEGVGDLLIENRVEYLMESMTLSILGQDPSVNNDKRTIVYTIDIYPTYEMIDRFVTNGPLYNTFINIGIFIFTVGVFVIYDRIMINREETVVEYAKASDNVIDSLFPNFVKHRVVHGDTSTIDIEQGIIPQYLKPKRQNSYSKIEQNPMSCSFDNCTVIFADIAGFTNWSHLQSSNNVFLFLETLYGKFDMCAEQQELYKVETIGDCYVAVAGLPNEQDNHADICVRFSVDMLECLSNTKRKLYHLFGDSINGLDLRVGLHSGTVTGGVLRGKRYRFQLYGDVVNVASRMESTSIAGKIQLSEYTFQCMKQADTVEMRKGFVRAKGVGLMQTYWVIPERVNPKVFPTIKQITKPNNSTDFIKSYSAKISQLISALKTNTVKPNEIYQKFSEVPNHKVTNERVLSTSAFEWDFDVTVCNDNLLTEVILGYFDRLRLYNSISINKDRFCEFIRQLHKHHNIVPYHNIGHVTSVVHYTYMMLVVLDEQQEGPKFTKAEQFAALLSAALHDIDHRGHTSLYERNSKSDIGKKYSECTNAMEKYHVSYSAYILSTTDFDFFDDPLERIEVELTLKACILGTDMGIHNYFVRKLQDSDDYSAISHQMWLNILLHAADLNNPVRIFPISQEWSCRLATEFHIQCELEKTANLPVLPFMIIVDEKQLCKNELFFAEQLAGPLWKGMLRFIPALSILTDNLEKNIQIWTELRDNYEEYNS